MNSNRGHRSSLQPQHGITPFPNGHCWHCVMRSYSMCLSALFHMYELLRIGHKEAPLQSYPHYSPFLSTLPHSFSIAYAMADSFEISFSRPRRTHQSTMVSLRVPWLGLALPCLAFLRLLVSQRSKASPVADAPCSVN